VCVGGIVPAHEGKLDKCKILERCFARLRPRLLDQCIAYLRQHTTPLPPPKVVVDGLPQGEVVGGLSPLAARFEDIQDGVRGFTRGVVSGVSAGFGFVAVEGAFEDGFEDCPFVVG
jgi:hypothetical protein